MDQPGRYRSRIGKPSGLRAPSARGAAAAASPCPAAQGIAPCPGAAAATPSQQPQVQPVQPAMTRPVSRLVGPRVQRPASPPRAPDPSTPRRAIPKPSGLRPPGSYAAASRLPSGPRTIPQPKPQSQLPTAATVPVAKVVSPGPRVASPARTVAVQIPRDSPVATAVIAAATPPQRRIPSPSRLRSPGAGTESLVAVPVIQPPGSPPKSILVPESVAAAQDEPIVSLPKTPPMDEVDRNWEEVEARLYRERGTPTPRTRRRRRRLSRAPRLSPVMERGSPEEAAATVEAIKEYAAAAIEQKVAEEEDAVTSALRYIQDQRRRLVLSPERASKAIARQVLMPATMRYIDQKWDGLMRGLYGDQFADALLQVEPITPTSDERWEALALSAGEHGLLEVEEMPEFFPGELARRLSFGSESPSSSSLSPGSATGLSSNYGTIAGSNPPVDAAEFIDNFEAPPEFFLLDLEEEPIDYYAVELEDVPQSLPQPLRPRLPPPPPVMDYEDIPENLPEPLQPYRTPPPALLDFRDLPENLPPPLLPVSPRRGGQLPPPLIPTIVTYQPQRLSPTLRSPIGSPTALTNRPCSPVSMPRSARSEEEVEEEDEDLYKILKY